MRAEEQPNLQNPTLTRKQLKLNVEQVIYSIPTEINGQICRKIASEKVYVVCETKKEYCEALIRRPKQWLIKITKSS